MKKFKLILALTLALSVVPATYVNVKAEENEKIAKVTFIVDSEQKLETAIANKEKHITITHDLNITKTHSFNHDVTIVGLKDEFSDTPILTYIGKEETYVFSFTNNNVEIGNIGFENAKGGLLINDAEVTLIDRIDFYGLSEAGVKLQSVNNKPTTLYANEHFIDYDSEYPSIIVILNEDLVKVHDQIYFLYPREFLVDNEVHYYHYYEEFPEELAVRDSIIANMNKFSGDDYSFKAFYWLDRHQEGVEHIIDLKTKTISVDTIVDMLYEILLVNDNIHSFKVGVQSERLYIKNNPNFKAQLKVEVQKEIDDYSLNQSYFYDEKGAMFGFNFQYWEVDIEKDKVKIKDALDTFINNSGYVISYVNGDNQLVVHNNEGFDVDSKVKFIMNLLDSLGNVSGFLLEDAASEEFSGQYIYLHEDTLEQSKEYIYNYFSKARVIREDVTLKILTEDRLPYTYQLAFTTEDKAAEVPLTPLTPAKPKEEPVVPETPVETPDETPTSPEVKPEKTPEAPKVEDKQEERVPTGIENTAVAYGTIIALSILVLINVFRKKKVTFSSNC